MPTPHSVAEVSVAGSAAAALESYKRRTREKLSGLLCPTHGKPPRINFEGGSLMDVRVSLSACCERLIRIANKAIAS